MAQPKLQQTLVDGIDVSSYVITWKIIREFGSKITTGEITFNNNILNTVSFDYSNAYHTIRLSRGVSSAVEDIVFRGEIYSFEKTGSAVICQIKDELYKAVRTEITRSYDKNIDSEAGVISEIIKDMLDDCGLNYTSTTIQNSGTLNTITKYVCNHADAFERMTKLAGLIDWQFYYSPNDNYVYFEPLGYTSSTSTLTVGANISESPKWKYDKSQMCNKFSIIGGEEEVETEETFNGDGSEDTFALDYTPKSVRVEVGGVLKIGGNDTTTTSFDYKVDIENKSIIFESGSIPPAGVGNVKVIYTHMLPRPVVVRNSNSISTHGEYRKTSFLNELRDINDVEGYAKKFIQIYSQPFLSTTLSVVDVTDIWPGQQIRVVDSANNIDQYFLVSKVEVVYPYRGDMLYVGDEELREQDWGMNAAIRIRRLEEEIGKNQDRLIQIFDYSHDITLQRRYIKLQKTILDLNNSFIVGHSSAGILGTSKLGRSVATAAYTSKLHQGDNIYREYCYDEDFHNSINSSATFDTTNKKIDFTAGQVWYSLPVFIGTDYNDGHATLDLGTAAGTCSYSVSVDDRLTWNSLTESIRKLLTGNEGTSFNDFSTVSGWSADGGAVAVNTSIYYDAGGLSDSTALSMSKTSTVKSYSTIAKTLTSPINASGFDTVYIYLYIDNSTTLSKIKDSSFEFLRIGNDSLNYYYINKAQSNFAAGWNEVAIPFSSLSTVGSVNSASLDYLKLTLSTDNLTDTWAADSVIWDSCVLGGIGNINKKVVLKIVENASQTAYITNNLNVYGEKTEPAIALLMEE